MTTASKILGSFIFLLLNLSLQSQDLEIQARSLAKKDLPIGFPIQTLDTGFAVIEITVTNHGPDSFDLDPAALELSASGKKRLTRVRPTKIVPKLLKYYRPGGGASAPGPTFGSPYPGSASQLPTGLPPAPRDSGYSAATAQNLRTLLEGYEMKEGSLAQGVSNQGYLYVKSKKWGKRLAGGRAKLGGAVCLIE